MGLVVVKDFGAKPGLDVQDVIDTELSLVTAIGGYHLHAPGIGQLPGNLDAANLAAAPGFLACQVKEGRSRICLGTEKTDALAFGPGGTPHPEGPRALIVVTDDVEADTVTFWHCDPSPLIGRVVVYQDGVELTSFAFEGSGVAQGELVEFGFAYSLRAGTVLDFRWRDGITIDYLKTVAGAAPAQYGRLVAQIWGVARHRA